MKLTINLKSKICNEFKKYCSQLDMPDEDRPTLVYSGKRYVKMTEIHGGRVLCKPLVNSKYHDNDRHKNEIIFVNVKYHSSLLLVKRTLAHPLIHYKFGYSYHKETFERMLNLVLKGRISRSKNDPNFIDATSFDIDVIENQIRLDIQDSNLVWSIRESNAYMSEIAGYEENDLWEQSQSEWDPE